MGKKNVVVIVVLLALSMLLTACLGSTASEPAAQAVGEAETSVFQTAAVAQTLEAYNTLVAKLTQIAMVTPTPLPPTSTPVTPTSTNTPLTPTVTASVTATMVLPTLTSVPPTAAPTQPGCYQMTFVQDVTVPDGAVFAANEAFIKTWRLKNTGSCTWTTDFELIFSGGDAMSGPASQPIASNVLPGQVVDISVNLRAPASAGDYTGEWKLRGPTGVVFGLGPAADKSFFLKITVKNISASTTDSTLDFAYNYCSAVWSNPVGSLSCPSTPDDFTNGSITRSSSPLIEGNYQDDEVALILIPSNGNGGMITGRYPAINIKSGDRFVALIGCMYNSPECNVLFQLNYRNSSGSVTSLGSWTETYDGKWTQVNVDLNGLANQSVELILTAHNNNGTSTDDRLFVMVPKVKR